MSQLRLLTWIEIKFAKVHLNALVENDRDLVDAELGFKKTVEL